MQITFDPHNQDDVKAVMQFFGDSAAEAEVSVPVEEDIRGGVELDSNGTPWIEGIHATTKSKKNDGTWTKRRGADDDEVHKAEVEARAKLAATPEPAADLPQIETPVEETAPVVSIEQLTEAFAKASAIGVIDAAGMMDLYKEVGIEPKEVGTNETARAKLVAMLEDRMANPPAAAAPGLPGLPA